MSKKQTLVNKFKELRTRLALVATAGILGVGGYLSNKPTLKNQENNKVDKILQEIDQKIIGEGAIESAQEILNDVGRILPKRKNEQFEKNIQEVEEVSLEYFNDYSIVDFLDSKGYDSSFASRAKLANDYGINDYRGTKTQNLQLLNILKGIEFNQDSSINQEQTLLNDEEDTLVENVPEYQEQLVDEVDGPSKTITDSTSNHYASVSRPSSGSHGSNHDSVVIRPIEPDKPDVPVVPDEPDVPVVPDEPDDNNEHKHDIQVSFYYYGKGNGTHEVVRREYCTANDYEKKDSQIVDCEDVFDYYVGDLETVHCKDCGDVHTRAHQPVKGETLPNGDVLYICQNEGCDWSYVETLVVDCEHDYIKNAEDTFNIVGDGKHEKVETLVCSKCNDVIEKKSLEDCLGEIVDYNLDYETLECSVCHDTYTQKHIPVKGETLPNGNILYTCQNEGCDWSYVEVPGLVHDKHTYELVDWNDDEEILECTFESCDKTITRAHNPKAGDVDEFGNREYTCQNEGCGWTKQDHIHHTRVRTEKVGTEDVCTQKVTYCDLEGCGEIISVEENPDHKFRTSSDGGARGCRICGFKPSKKEVEELLPEDEPELMEEVSNDVLLSTPEIPEDKEQTQVPEVSEDKEETQEPEASEDKEETQEPEVPEDKEETQEPEVPEDKEETQVPEVPEDKEETQIPEVPEDKEETQVPEVPEDKEETQVPEVPEDKEETQVPEVPEDKEETQVPEVPEDKEETQEPEASEDKEETQNRRVIDNSGLLERKSTSFVYAREENSESQLSRQEEKGRSRKLVLSEE